MSSIDVIMPVKGRPQLLQERSLPSLLHQSIQDFKVTIIDDGSDPEDFVRIQSIAEEHRNKGLLIDVLKNKGAAGAAGARNFGFECTSGEYVLWFDSDDTLLENKLEVSIKLIQTGDYDLAITRAQHIQNGKMINEFWGEPIAPNRGIYEFHFPYQTMCALYKRQFLIRDNIRWNEKNNLNDDWEISNEVLLKTNKWLFSPEITAHYFVPTPDSGSIGSRLTKTKIEAQKKAFQKIQQLLDDKALSYSRVSRGKLFYHSLRLFILSHSASSLSDQ